MLRFFVIFVCWLGFTPAFGQASVKIDSLMTLLKDTPKGQRKIELYEKICWSYIDSKPDLALATKYADSLKLLSEELNNKNGYHQAQYSYGVIAQNQGNFTKAQEYLQEYIAYYKFQGDSSQLAKGLFHSALVNLHVGNFEKSLATLYRTLAIEEKANNLKKVATILNTIGAVHKNTKKFNEAIEAYSHAAKIFKSLYLNVDYGMCLQNSGNIFIAQERFDTAQQVYEEALGIFIESKNPVFIGTVLGNLGNLHESRNEYDLALQYHQRALFIWRQNTRKRQLANCLNNLGKTYLKLKKYDEADKSLREALQIIQEIKARPLLFETYSTLTALHFDRKDYEKAYHFSSLSNQVKDSIFNESNAKQINELETKYETEKKDKQIALLAKEKEIQEKETERQSTLNNAFIVGLVLVILLAILIVYVYRQRLRLIAKNNEVKEAELRHKVSELEMKALRAQINPHFLFNCMNAINLMILKGEAERASLYLAKFSKLVRVILENAEASSVTLESEMALLESYMQLEELRLPGKIGYTISVDESIGVQSTYLPSMVLQPVVENAIWHGIAHKENDATGIISIDVRQQDDHLRCTIEDNGVGRDRAQELRDKSVLKNKSMGMKITEERLRLRSRKDMHQCIEFTDLKNTLNQAIGTRVVVLIPISEQDD